MMVAKVSLGPDKFRYYRPAKMREPLVMSRSSFLREPEWKTV